MACISMIKNKPVYFKEKLHTYEVLKRFLTLGHKLNIYILKSPRHINIWCLQEGNYEVSLLTLPYRTFDLWHITPFQLPGLHIKNSFSRLKWKYIYPILMLNLLFFSNIIRLKIIYFIHYITSELIWVKRFLKKL